MKTKVRVKRNKKGPVGVSIKFIPTGECVCLVPLEGYKIGVGPRCRLCNLPLNPLETECDFDRADELTVRGLK